MKSKLILLNFMKILKKFIFVITVIILGGLGGIIADRYLFPYLAATRLFSRYDFLKKSTENVVVINKTEQVVMKEETSLGKIASQVVPSVVNILSFPAPDKKPLPRVRNTFSEEAKNGTGVIVTSDGIVMTYLTAINPKDSAYKVITQDGNTHDAEMLGIDSYSNLVFFKINSSDLPAVSFGNSEGIKPGEKIMAVGNNLGYYANQYAAGIIKNFNMTRNISGTAVSFSDKLEGVFETDMEIYDGLTGGPVIDYSGQTIGIIGSLPNGSERIFFQIPAEKVRKVIEKAIKKELSNVPALGMYYMPLTKSYALSHGIARETGAMIYSPSGQPGLAFLAGSAAQKSGLQINDIITAINGEEVTLEKGFSNMLYQYKKGDEIELTVFRGGEEMKVKVRL